MTFFKTLDEGQWSSRDEKYMRWSLQLPQVIACRKFAGCGAVLGSPGRAGGPPELRISRWGSRETKATRIHWAEYQGGESGTEKESQISAEAPLENSVDCWSAYSREKTTQGRGENDLNRLEVTMPAAHSGPGILPVLTARLENLLIYGALGKILIKVLLH